MTNAFLKLPFNCTEVPIVVSKLQSLKKLCFLSYFHSLETRPPLNKSDLRDADQFLERISLLALIFLWAYTFISYKHLPAIIPLHFNAKAEADNFGSRSFLFILPLICTGVYILLSLATNFRQKLNFPFKIPAHQLKQQIFRSSRLLRIMKLMIVFLFIILMHEIIRDARQGFSDFKWWYIPTFEIVMILPLGIYIYRSYKASRM